MDIVLTAEPATTREPIPAETYVARCVEMIQLGTVEKTYDGKAKQLPQLRLTWELPAHPVEYDGKSEPARISQNFTASLHEKSGLRKLLNSWRGKDLTEVELQGFKLNNLLGVPCMLTVSHAVKDGKTYANISSVVKLMKEITPPAQVHATRVLAYGPDFDWAVYDGLPGFLKKIMEATPEWKKQSAGRTAPAAQPAHANPAAPAPVADEDLPF